MDRPHINVQVGLLKLTRMLFKMSYRKFYGKITVVTEVTKFLVTREEYRSEN